MAKKSIVFTLMFLFMSWAYTAMFKTSDQLFTVVDSAFILGSAFAVVMNVLIKRKYKQHLEIDKLTGLMTKYKLFRLVEEKLKKAKPNEYLIATIDVDKFKTINTSYGYLSGNKFLLALADRLEQCFAKNAILAREHDDIFIAFMKNTYNGKTLCGKEKCTNCIYQHVAQQMNIPIPFGLSVGLYIIDNPKIKLDYILDCAHTARHVSKTKYSESITVFTKEMQEKQRKQNKIVSSMESALKNDEFYIELQPKFDIATGDIVRAEALVRWETKDGKRFYPDEFIPIFEDNGFIVELDAYVFEKTCELIANFSDTLPRISVNLSAVTAGHEELIPSYRDILQKYNVDASRIEIEVTESAFSGYCSRIYNHIAMLKEMGFTVAIDDFGTGVSSLGRLKDMNVDVLKIDKSFVDVIGTQKGDIIIKSIIAMAKDLQLQTVAEGIETQSQLQSLQSLGCDVGQGYYFAKPMRIPAFLQFLASHTVTSDGNHNTAAS